jgi:hypothetical protein
MIQADVEKSGMYAIISDCCTDMITDNLSLCLRYVAMDTGVVHERFVQFTDLSSNELGAESIVNKIVSILQQGSRFQVSLSA